MGSIALKLCKCGKVFWEKDVHCEYTEYKRSKLKIEKIILRTPKRLPKKKRGVFKKLIKILKIAIRRKITLRKVTRKNGSNRIKLPVSLKTAITNRSQYICEEKNCNKKAEATHHIVAVSKRPDLQLEVWNLIHICIKHHRARHPELPDCLFYKK